MSTKVDYLRQIANFLRVPQGNITVNPYQMPTRVSSSSQSVKGFLNIILALLKESDSCQHLIPVAADVRAEVFQWIEYALVYGQSGVELLNGLDGFLLRRTYLVSNELTMADVVLYYTLQSVMEEISYLEKEKYVNVCRWFDNLQQNVALRQGNNVIDFNTSYLSSMAPAKH